MKLEPIIGLEIHVQLKTTSKMFCGCENGVNQKSPNSAICPICMGHPGTLPVPNAEAVRLGVRGSLALGCTINVESKFDRKHYFYPDLPKGYQITQFDAPVGINGSFTILSDDREQRTIRIERLHLEEDAAKNMHGEDGVTLIDYNRAGTPLAEIVTHPDFRTPQEAKKFLQELRLLMRTIGVSNADMEKGQMRCDANISLREEGSNILHPKTEIKNLNSFKSVERALQYEIERQTDLWRTNTPPAVTTTRGWNDVKETTFEQRTKEAANDYRYFPEPDIPQLHLDVLLQEETARMPELPRAKIERFMNEYQFKEEDAFLLVEQRELGNFAENVMSELWNYLLNVSDIEGTHEELISQYGTKLGNLVAGWITSKLLGIFAIKKIDIESTSLTAENFAELMFMIFTKKINSTVAQRVLETMVETGADPEHILENDGWNVSVSAHDLETIVNQIISEQADAVAKYKSGKTALMQFFVGMVMKKTKGSSDPEHIQKLFEQKLT